MVIFIAPGSSAILCTSAKFYGRGWQGERKGERKGGLRHAGDAPARARTRDWQPVACHPPPPPPPPPQPALLNDCSRCTDTPGGYTGGNKSDCTSACTSSYEDTGGIRDPYSESPKRKFDTWSDSVAAAPKLSMLAAGRAPQRAPRKPSGATTRVLAAAAPAGVWLSTINS